MESRSLTSFLLMATVQADIPYLGAGRLRSFVSLARIAAKRRSASSSLRISASPASSRRSNSSARSRSFLFIIRPFTRSNSKSTPRLITLTKSILSSGFFVVLLICTSRLQDPCGPSNWPVPTTDGAPARAAARVAAPTREDRARGADRLRRRGAAAAAAGGPGPAAGGGVSQKKGRGLLARGVGGEDCICPRPAR